MCVHICVCVFDLCKYIYIYIYVCVCISASHTHFYTVHMLTVLSEWFITPKTGIHSCPICKHASLTKRKTEGRKPSPFPPHTKPSQPTGSPNSSVAGHRLQWNRFGSQRRHGDVDLAPCLDVVGEKDSSLSILASQSSLYFCM